MKKIGQISFAAITGFLFFYNQTSPVYAKNKINPDVRSNEIAGASASLRPVQYFYKKAAHQTDARTEILREYLNKRNSPLAQHAHTFVATAERYNLNYRLLPAISGIESSFGRRVPYNSYNPFGWSNGKYQFENWDKAIQTVGRALKLNYIDKCGTESVDQIGPIYAPPNPSWDSKVRFFMQDIKQFESNQTSLALRLSI